MTSGILQFCFFIAALLVAFPGQDAVAESLSYSSVQGDPDSAVLQSYMDKKNLPQPDSLFLSRVDLNDDGMDEFIVKNENCENSKALCEHIILAQTLSEKIIEIGSIRAKSLVLSPRYHEGVRTLQAYDNPENDFAFSQYVWDAGRSRYILGAEK